MGIGLPVIQMWMKIAFSTHRLSKTKFLGFGGSNTNWRSESHETRLTPPKHQMKTVGRNGIRIGLPVLQICMKIAFSTHRLSRVEFFRFGGRNVNHWSDSHETWLTPPIHLKKAVGRNGMGIGLPVLYKLKKLFSCIFGEPGVRFPFRFFLQLSLDVWEDWVMFHGYRIYSLHFDPPNPQNLVFESLYVENFGFSHI